MTLHTWRLLPTVPRNWKVGRHFRGEHAQIYSKVKNPFLKCLLGSLKGIHLSTATAPWIRIRTLWEDIKAFTFVRPLGFHCSELTKPAAITECYSLKEEWLFPPLILHVRKLEPQRLMALPTLHTSQGKAGPIMAPPDPHLVLLRPQHAPWNSMVPSTYSNAWHIVGPQ